MPTTKPRLNVTLSPESRAALERFSKATGVAASQFVGSLVQDSIPVIDAMTKAISEARTAPRKAASTMGTALNDALIQAMQAKLDLDEHVHGKKLRRRPRRD